MPKIEYDVQAGENELRLFFAVTGYDAPPIPTYYRLPVLASGTEIAGGDTTPGLGLPGEDYVILPSTLDFSTLVYRYFTGDTVEPYYIAYLGTKYRDAVMLDPVGTEWAVLTRSGDLLLIPSMDRMSIPSEYTKLVREARKPECVKKLATALSAESLGVFSSEQADVILAWKANKLTILVDSMDCCGLTIRCDEKPNITIVKTFAFPEPVLWAGEYMDTQDIWVLTEGGKVYAIPIISYKFQTGYLVVSPDKIKPYLVGEADSFAVIQVSTYNPILLLAKNGKITALEIDNEWEGKILVKPIRLRIQGASIEEPVKAIYTRDSGDGIILAIQTTSNELHVYTVEDLNWEDENTATLVLGQEEAYKLKEGVRILGISMYTRYGDEDLAKLLQDNYGVSLGTDIKITSITALSDDGKTIIGVLDFTPHKENNQ